MKPQLPEIGNLTLLDCLSCGIPWPESRKNVYKAAPEECVRMISPNGVFHEVQPVTDAEKEALNEMMSLDAACKSFDEYITHPRAGIREGDSRLRWCARHDRTDTALNFFWADLRELKLKMLFHRQFQGAYHPDDFAADQITEMFRCYNRLLHTFRRMKCIRWIKLSVRQGQLKVYIFNEDARPSHKIQTIFERSFHRSDQPPVCDPLDEKLWASEQPHVLKRIEFWRLEELGQLTDDDIHNALNSDDEVLATWAVDHLNKADGPEVVELIRKQIKSKSAEEARAAIRAAGRLWLNDLEQDVMQQYNRRGNSIGPAVADFIGSLGMTGRPFLPKILRALTRRGDFATLISTIRALAAFPHSAEAAALPDTLAVILGIADDAEPILERFPGIRTDIYGPQDPPPLLQKFSLEVLRAAAVHQIIESTAKSAKEKTFVAAAKQIRLNSPFLEKLLLEIEKNSRSDAAGYLQNNILTAAATEAKSHPGVPVARRVVLAARTLLRITDPSKSADKLIELLPLIAAHVDSYRRDSKLQHSFFIENYPSEPFITLKSILKGLPGEDEIIDRLLRRENFSDFPVFSDKEKYLIREIARED